jgi:hypothetical protein
LAIRPLRATSVTAPVISPVNMTLDGLMDPLQSFRREPYFFRLGRLDRRGRQWQRDDRKKNRLHLGTHVALLK